VLVHQLFVGLPLIGKFAILFGLIVLLPRIAERLGLPGVVGLLGGGVLLGPELLGVIDPASPVIQLFGELGKLLLMFCAGYEVNLAQFQKVAGRSLAYGVLTFGLPLLIGAAIASVAGYPLNGAVLIGSLLASHTLLGLPILKNLDLMGRDSAVVTIGATIFTDIAAMLVLAVCLSIHSTGFSPRHLALTLLGLAIYVPGVIFGLSWLARTVFRIFGMYSDTKVALLILLILVSALGAEAIELEGIVGAFLSGIAVKRALGESEAGETLTVMAHTLFIPVFFLGTGFLVNIRVFGETLVNHAPLVAGIVGGLLVSKFLAAQAAGLIFRVGRDDRLLMWSLSVPQVAATLAAALVAYTARNASGERLIDEAMLNTVVVLVLATSVIGPVVTRIVGKRLAATQGAVTP
jgi:Kef-type K+ transport system membrane component KefB